MRPQLNCTFSFFCSQSITNLIVLSSSHPQSRTTAPQFAAVLFCLRFNRDQKLFDFLIILGIVTHNFIRIDCWIAENFGQPNKSCKLRCQIQYVLFICNQLYTSLTLIQRSEKTIHILNISGTLPLQPVLCEHSES